MDTTSTIVAAILDFDMEALRPFMTNEYANIVIRVFWNSFYVAIQSSSQEYYSDFGELILLNKRIYSQLLRQAMKMQETIVVHLLTILLSLDECTCILLDKTICTAIHIAREDKNLGDVVAFLLKYDLFRPMENLSFNLEWISVLKEHDMVEEFFGYLAGQRAILDELLMYAGNQSDIKLIEVLLANGARCLESAFTGAVKSPNQKETTDVLLKQEETIKYLLKKDPGLVSSTVIFMLTCYANETFALDTIEKCIKIGFNDFGKALTIAMVQKDRPECVQFFQRKIIKQYNDSQFDHSTKRQRRF